MLPMSNDRLSRRHFMLAGVGVLIGGCATQNQGLAKLPGPPWPRIKPALSPIIRTPSVPVITPSFEVPAAQLHALGRDQWARGRPLRNRLNAMHVIKRITVHHEGWTRVPFDDFKSTAARLESIRNAHLGRGFGDIGYHYIIDRKGRLWQGRDMRYQGAHVRDHNEHNLGVMVLGNFNRQSPTDEQYQTLRRTLVHFMKKNRVARAEVHTHQELGPTSCPGHVLQAHMVELRRGRLG